MLLHSDGFDSHATGAATLADGSPKWTGQSAVTIAAAAGKFGGQSLRLAAATAGYAELSVTGTFVAFAGYFKVATSSNPVVLARDVTNGVDLVTRNSNGALVVRDGADNVRITSAAAAHPDGEFVWLEVSYRSDGVYLAVNGLPVGSFVGAYTGPDFSPLRLINSAGTGIGQIDVDDLIVWDDQGSYFNTFGVPLRRITLLRPDGPGASTSWVPNGATNWQSVDDTNWSGGAGVVSTVAGQKDLYTMTDLPIAPSTINAVVVRAKAVNAGDNPAALALLVRGADGSEAAGPVTTVATGTPAVIENAFYRDSAGAAWTAGSVNAVQAGQQSNNVV